MKANGNSWHQKAAAFTTAIIGGIVGLGLQCLLSVLSEQDFVGCPLLFRYLVRRFRAIWTNNNAMFFFISTTVKGGICTNASKIRTGQTAATCVLSENTNQCCCWAP